MAREYRRLVALVYGQTGSGKTILARALLQERLKALGPGSTGLIVDTLQEHFDVPAIAPDSLSNYLSVKTSKPRIGRVLLDSEADFDEFSHVLQTSKDRGPVVLMVDEVSFWSSPSRSTPGLSRIIRYGRHWQVDIIGVARRPAETSRELSAQATVLYIIGRVVEPRDQLYLRQILPPGAMTKSGTLGDFHYLKYCTKGTYTLCSPVNIS